VNDATYLVTDIECSGFRPGEHSMLSFATVAVTGSGAERGRFEAVLAALPGAGWDAGTRAWFETSEPEALKAATTDPRDPAEVMADFVAFVRDLPAPRIFAAHPVAFDVCGGLPTGTTVLEASAGTGKTFTIAALAARYVAEGHARLPELLLVTFGRDATQELRERVRERLVSAERGLRDPATARAGTDSVLALLAGVPDAEVAVRRRRLTAALAEFDAATIATTHQFCGQMLTTLGIAGDADDAVFVESVDDLVVEVADDFYVRKFAAKAAGTPAFDRVEALRLARRAVGDPQARLEPAVATGAAAVRHAFATAVRGEVERRKRARGLHTYDDLVTRLHDALADPVRGAAARLRSRYRVVLVDEFQDTDPLQWGILRHFAGHLPLVLIGDPKQAIYAFRGADVVSYLNAVDTADAHATLARNWRSDAGLLGALDTVFDGAALGDPRIVVREVESAHPLPRLQGAPVDAPLRLRVLTRDGLPCSGRGLVLTPEARSRVARDVAADVAALLASGATVAEAPLRPGDVAVLVRTNDQGTVVRDALAAVGVPAVLSGTASVFGTPAAREWLTLLNALEQPRPLRIRDAALTCFLGEAVNYVNAEKLAAARGIEVVRAVRPEPADYPHLVGVTVGGEGGEVDLAGALFGERDARVVRFRGFQLEFRPEGRLMVLSNRDVPGVVGRLGTILGDAGINIAEIHLARIADGGDAMAVLRLDGHPAPEVMAHVAALPRSSRC